MSWFHRNLSLSNQHCLYCGEYVGVGASVESDKEHLINRRIAAPGLMANPQAFNFIFRACRRCNAEKADIEEHISAVTLLTSPGREDPVIDAAARSKAAASFDRRHRLPIGEVRNNLSIAMGPVTFGMVSAAQADPEAIRLLAFRHVQGLFSLCTSPDPRHSETTRLLSGDKFGFFAAYPYRDWGNPRLLEIARRTQDYARLAEITTADGFFRAALRPGAQGSPWFWALEWNQNLRVVGWIGDPLTPADAFQDLPPLTWHRISSTHRIREETPLAEDAEDLLFDPI
ncbi:MAG: hypothetical protein V4466_00015 [Pseudomonadota bacterium]